MNAVEQILAFWGMLVVAWWLTICPHDDDGVDVPLRRLFERSLWMLQFDPGLSNPPREVDVAERSHQPTCSWPPPTDHARRGLP